MIAQEDYLVIHKLHALGYSITQIARELQLDRKTVRRHLARAHPPAYQRAPRPSKLDPYRTWIRTRLAAAPLTVGILLLSLTRFAALAARTLTRLLAALARGTPAAGLAGCPP